MPEPQGYLEASILPYSDNQPVDLNLWNNIFPPILLIEVKEFLSSDV